MIYSPSSLECQRYIDYHVSVMVRTSPSLLLTLPIQLFIRSLLDIVFLIFVLQWYMYGSDKRRNEYGEFIEDPVVEEKKEEEKKAETGAKKAEEKKAETGAKKRKDTKKEKNSEPVENQPEKKGK